MRDSGWKLHVTRFIIGHMRFGSGGWGIDDPATMTYFLQHANICLLILMSPPSHRSNDYSGERQHVATSQNATTPGPSLLPTFGHSIDQAENTP